MAGSWTCHGFVLSLDKLQKRNPIPGPGPGQCAPLQATWCAGRGVPGPRSWELRAKEEFIFLPLSSFAVLFLFGGSFFQFYYGIIDIYHCLSFKCPA